MSYYFDLDTIKEILENVGEIGKWKTVKNGEQFEALNGGYINCFSTNTVNCQGNSVDKVRLENILKSWTLDVKGINSSSNAYYNLKKNHINLEIEYKKLSIDINEGEITKELFDVIKQPINIFNEVKKRNPLAIMLDSIYIIERDFINVLIRIKANRNIINYTDIEREIISRIDQQQFSLMRDDDDGGMSDYLQITTDVEMI